MIEGVGRFVEKQKKCVESVTHPDACHCIFTDRFTLNKNFCEMKKNIFKSILSVLAGLFTVILLSNGTDTILEMTGVFPSITEQQTSGFRIPWMAGLALSYRLIFLLVGGYVTAKLAPAKPMRHVLILGIIGCVLGMLGAIASWGFAPGWFLLSPILAGLPLVWLGGLLNRKLTTVKS
jgi:hypothetical protein